MKMLALACVCLCLAVPACLVAQDLESIPTDQARAFGERLVELAEKVEGAQVKVEGDASLANGVHLPEELGILVIPQKDLKESEELAEKFKAEKGTPLAYLFAYRVVPVVDGKRVPASRLHTIKAVDGEGKEHQVQLLLLAVRQQADDDYRLYGYGTEATPIVNAKFSEGTASGSGPVVVTVKDTDEATREGTVVVTVFGKYQASFRAAQQEE
jgi:hypothetical protein